MAKCGACGKYLSVSEGPKCSKCPATYHRSCVSIPATSIVSPSWVCPGCKAKIPRDNNCNTPVSGTSRACSPHTQQAPVGMTPSGAQGDAVEDTHQAMISLAAEIRAFRSELSAVRAELSETRSELAEFKLAIHASNARIELIDGRLSSLERKFEESVPTNVDAVEDTICSLRQELNERDQELLLNDVEISGVPEHHENNLVHLVKLLALKLGSEVQDGDIVHTERVGPMNRNHRELENGTMQPPRPRNIVVRFARRVTREQLITAARVRRNLSSSDLELQGAPRRVYINERLTRTNRQLFARAREAARRSHYKYVWTKEGKIFVRKEDGQKAERIKSEKDLVRIFGSSLV